MGLDEPTWKKRGCGTSVLAWLVLVFWLVVAVVWWGGLLFLLGQMQP